MHTKLLVIFLAMSAVLLAFGFIGLRRPALLSRGYRIKRENGRLALLREESTSPAALRMMKSVALGLVFGGFACLALGVVCTAYPQLIELLSL